MFYDPHVGPIGIDVSDGSLEAAQVHVRTGRRALLGYGRADLPPGAVKGGRVVRPQALAEALQQLLMSPAFGEFEGRAAVLAMPEQHCFHQVMRVPHSHGLAMEIEKAIGARLPFPLAEANWDSHHLYADGEHSLHRSLAVPADVFDEYVAALQRLSLRVDAIESQLACGQRGHAHALPRDRAALLMDIGNNETAVGILDVSGIHQSTVVPMGLRQGKSALADILTEGRHQITYYRYQEPSAAPAGLDLVLLGSGATIDGLAAYLAEQLGVSAHVAENTDLDHPLTPFHLALAATAIGASLGGMRHLAQDSDNSLQLSL